MKQWTAILLLICTLFIQAQPCLAAELPVTTSDAYVVMDAESGQVLIEKNMHQKGLPASLTKVLTVALGLEHGKPEDKVVVGADSVTSDGTHIALQAGEELTLGDLANAALVTSANDAANAIGEHTAGKLTDFPAMMNAKAAEIGCKNTHFNNASGMPDPEHYTTAYDLALITRYAIGVPNFMAPFGAPDYSIPPTNLQASQRQDGTDHMMLVTSAYYYEGTLGGKLGWTEDAQHTAVTLVERNGLKLIVVVLKNTKYGKFKDSVALLDYCYNEFVPVRIKGSDLKTFDLSMYRTDGSAENVHIYADDSYRVMMRKDATEADISISYNVPEYYSDGDEIQPTVVLTVRDGVQGMYAGSCSYPLQYQRSPTAGGMEAIAPSDLEPITIGTEFLQACAKFFKAVGIILVVVAGLVAALLILRFAMRIAYRRRRKIRHRNRLAAQARASMPPADRMPPPVRRRPPPPPPPAPRTARSKPVAPNQRIPRRSAPRR